LEDVKESNIFIITVPTPIDESNRPDLNPLISASTTVGKILKNNDIVVYESTVYPGCTEEICVPILEKVSGLTFNHDFFCGYSPERINPGDKINTITTIKKITSGSNKVTTERIDELYKTIISAGTYKASSIKIAEAAKVIENTQRDLNIALVNELSVIFDKLEIDTMQVLEAAGSKWNFLPFKPGLVGGHCIGIDPYYLTHKAEQVGYNPQVILAGRRINDNMAKYSVEKIIQKMILNGLDIKNCTVGILGATFKENCPDIRNSKNIDLFYELKKWGVNVVISDPWADPLELEKECNIQLCNIDSENQVDSIIVAVGHDEFRAKSPVDLKSYCRVPNPVIGDLKSIYDKGQLENLGFTVFRL
jgi:UDP-N-acetyl-D-galactosamine dehydrogenase